MNYYKLGKSCFIISVLVFTYTLIGDGVALLKEEHYLIANKTLWIQTKTRNSSLHLPDICSNARKNTFENSLQGCIFYIESVSHENGLDVYLREISDLCRTCIRKSLCSNDCTCFIDQSDNETSPETWQIGCDNTTTTSDIVLLTYVFLIDGTIENLESGTWIGDVCMHNNVSYVKLKNLERCDHSSNTADLLFAQHVCIMKNSTNSEDLGLALPTEAHPLHSLFEKLVKAYNCAQECTSSQFFQVTFTEQEMKCRCERGIQEPSIQLDKETGQHIYEINADPALQGESFGTLGEDLCVVANLLTGIIPITFTVHTAYCNESFSTLCQQINGTKIKYIFSDNETTFMESSHFCKMESAYLFTPEDFQSQALETIAPFTKFSAEYISVWTGVIERKTWNPMACKMNIFSDNCIILTSSGTGTDSHYHGSHTTSSTNSTALHTTMGQVTEDKNKKNWFDCSNDCCLESKALYDKDIQIDEENFDIIEKMNAQNFTEIYLNNRVFPGPWIVPAGTYTFPVITQNASLSEASDIYDCAILCQKCWYFGMLNNSCVNISSLFHHAAKSSNNHTIDLYSSQSGNVLEWTTPSVGLDCVQVAINTEVFPVSYLLSVKDCVEPLHALCLRANDSTYLTSPNLLNFTDSKMFCKDKGATLASTFSNRQLYISGIKNGAYWTVITRKNNLNKKDCHDETDHHGYCRKMFLNGTIVTTSCTEKTYSICIKEKVETTISTTTSSTHTTTSVTTTDTHTNISTTTPSTAARHKYTSLDLTTVTTESHVIHVDYITKVIQNQKYSDAAIQCQRSFGSLWSDDLSDMEAKNVSQMLNNAELEETWTNYVLFVSKWIIQTGYRPRNEFLNLAMKPAAAYECANQCVDFPHFISSRYECQCLSDQANVSEYSENTTAVMYSAIKDLEIEAEELENTDKQCAVASINFKMFPMSYTLRGTSCNETHHVICQNFHNNVIRYSLANASYTYHEALEACANQSATIFNPRDYHPARLSRVFKSMKTETIWTAIFREFIWRILNESQEFYKEFDRLFCKVLGRNGTLESRPCSERSSALCFINRENENFTRIPTVSTTSQSGVDVLTTTEQITEDKNKKNWFECSNDCCLVSKTLYDKDIQIDEENFDIIQKMKALNFTEIYLNHRVYTGPWVVPAGTYTVNFQGASLFEVTDIYDCALLCRSCWYFGIMDNKCINISSLFHHPDESSDNHTIDLYSSNSGEVLETTVPSAGVDCVQVTIKMEVFPVSYSLSVKDCEESLTALCLRVNDSTYVTSQTQLNFTGSKKFCNDEGAILASFFSNRYLYKSRITSGTYWTPITRKNELRRKVCPDDAYPGGYCRKMFLNGTIVTMNCTEKSYSICVKEKVTTTTSTTTTSKAAPPSTTSLALTTATTESHVIRVNYSIMVIQDQNYNQTAIQCQQSYGSLWNYDLPDIYVTNVSQILKTKELGETWTNYGLFFSKWIIQTVYSGGLLKHFLNVTIYAEGAYHCASKCMDFPNFIPLKNECQCLSDSTNVSEYSENTTVVMYSTINDVEIEAEELENEDRQCVVASVNFKVFPMSYTLRGALCDEIHHVICQTFNDTVIGYIHLANTTYNAAVEACSNLSATIFNPRDYNPALLSNILNSNKTETIWTAISREFFWRNLIDTQDYFERLKRPVCRVLWSNGTLESRSCSERSSALCFINRDGEKITKIPTISTVSSSKDSENVTEIPKNSTISGTGTYSENVTTTPTNPNIQGASPHNPQAEHLPLYIVLPCGAIVILVIVLGVVIYIKRVQNLRKNGNTPENNGAVSDDVKSNIYGTIPKTMNDGVQRTDEQCEGDVLGMNGFSGGFYNSGIAEYSMVNKIPRPIKIQSNSDETNSSKPMNYGYQETDDYGDREEDNLEMSIFSDDTNIVNPGKNVYSVVDKNRQRTDPNQDGSYKEDSDKLPVFRHSTMFNEDTFSRRKFGERSGIYKL